MQKQAHAGTQWPGKNTDTKIYYNSEDINELSAIKMSPHSGVRYRISSMATDWIGEKNQTNKKNQIAAIWGALVAFVWNKVTRTFPVWNTMIL